MPKTTRKRRTTRGNQLSRPKKTPAKAKATNVSHKNSFFFTLNRTKIKSICFRNNKSRLIITILLVSLMDLSSQNQQAIQLN